MFSMLGAEFEELSAKDLKKLGIQNGIKVKKLNRGKLSKLTKIKEGFIITKSDNNRVSSKEDLKRLLQNKKGGVLIEGIYPGARGKYYYAIGL